MTNGMSYRARDGQNINGGFLVGVDPDGFSAGGPIPWPACRFQEQWEHGGLPAGRRRVPRPGPAGGGLSGRGVPPLRPGAIRAHLSARRDLDRPATTACPSMSPTRCGGLCLCWTGKLHGFAHPDGGAHRSGDPFFLPGDASCGTRPISPPCGASVPLRRGRRLRRRHHERCCGWHPSGGSGGWSGLRGGFGEKSLEIRRKCGKNLALKRKIVYSISGLRTPRWSAPCVLPVLAVGLAWEKPGGGNN